MRFQHRRLVALLLATVTTACSGDSGPAPTAVLSAPTSPGAIPITCPAPVQRQSTDALPVRITWDTPTVAGRPLERGSCAPVSGTSFPIGTSTVTCTADEPSYASACSFSVSITPPDPKLRFTRFLAFGDSITAGFVSAAALGLVDDPRDIPSLLRTAGARGVPGISRALEPLSAYPAVLQNLLTPAYATQQFTVANEGRPGERTDEGLRRLRATLLATTPDVLMLLEGVNDIDLALVERGPTSSAPIDVRGFADALRSMVTIAEGMGVEVLLATLTPISDDREEGDPGTRQAILALNAEIRAMPPTFGRGGVVDLFSLLNGVPGIIGVDGLHPTVAGYRRMGEIFFEEIVSRHDITPRAPAVTGP